MGYRSSHDPRRIISSVSARDTSSRWLARSAPETWGALARSEGPDYLVADCGSPESHERRLRAILRIPLVPGDTLVELGCGTGRLSDMLPEGVTYEGLDWSAEVVRLAAQRRPGVRFRHGTEDDLTRADWIVASGPFNYAVGWSKERTAAAIAAMWRSSRRGIAVTFLRVPTDQRLHYHPNELQRFVDGLDWIELQMDQSYLPNDICLRAWRSA